VKTATHHLSTNNEWCNENVDIKFSAHDAFLEFSLPLHTRSLNLSYHIAFIQIVYFICHTQATDTPFDRICLYSCTSPR